jgi:hypothetical protein
MTHNAIRMHQTPNVTLGSGLLCIRFGLLAEGIYHPKCTCKGKGTVKFTPKQAMKAQRGSGFKPLLFL